MGQAVEENPDLLRARAEDQRRKAELLQLELEKLQRFEEQGLDSRGLPKRPEFQSILDEETGKLQEQFQIGEFDPVARDTRALDRITEEGLAEGPSRAAQRQLDFLDTQQAQQFDQAQRGQRAGQVSAFDALARQGGLGGGSRERLARQAQRQGILGRQGLRAQGALQRQKVLADDEAAKRGLLQQAEAGAVRQTQLGQTDRQFEAQRRQFDIEQSLGEFQKKRQAELDAFSEERRGIAAEKQAEAQRRAACFAGDTMIEMADKTFKAIKDIDIDDSIMAGGLIHAIYKCKINSETPIYNYEGVIVSGGHPVLEDGKWVRVRESKKARLYDGEIDFVYSLANENHLIPIAGILFSDYEETDDFTISDEEAIRRLNDGLKIKGLKEDEYRAFC